MSCYEDDGFRMNDAISVCSIKSKAMIDSLFEDRASITSSNYSGWYTTINNSSINNHDNLQYKNGDDENMANSAVQARIEEMFASVEAETGKSGETAASILTVAYLGSAPVGGRVASVRGLQEPLRHLLEHMNNSRPAELEVSRRGLIFRLENTPEKINPFRRIAVWSAVRLHSRLVSNKNDNSLSSSSSNYKSYYHAFLPLVGNESTLECQDKYQDLYRTMRGLPNDVNKFPPIFAVIMRRPGATRVLECHAFACKSCEDAIAAAATLYKALLADLESNCRHPRQTNGLGCVSLASCGSSYMDNPSTISKFNYSSKCQAAPPIRPPRSKKNSSCSSVTDGESCKSIVMNISSNSNINFDEIKSIKNNNSTKINKKELKSSKHTFEESNSIRSMSENTKSQRYKLNDTKNSNENNKLTIITDKKSSSTSSTSSLSLSSTSNVMEKINNEKVYSRKMNCYEKTPRIIVKPSFDVEKNYKFIEKNNCIVVDSNDKQLFDKNHASYDVKKNNSPVESCQQSEVASSRKSSKSCCNSIYEKSSREKLYEKHFRDADKIMSIDSDNEEEIKSKKCNKLLINDRISRADEFKLSQRKNDNDIYQKDWRKDKKRYRTGSEPPLGTTEKINKLSNNNVKLKRSQSELEIERGDLMTRVELPRRSSFLKPGNNTRLQNNVNGGRTPLGFTELFDEFKNQEGLTSVDDILATIIDPEGMSFNDLKPLYKEFLLKLASTLTQDELYQRSANIMKKRKRPQRRRSTRKASFIGRAIKRSVSKFKNGPTEFTSVMIPAKKFNGSLDSHSSGDAKYNNKNRVLASRLSRRRMSWRRSKGPTTSEDSDTCKRISMSTGAGANRSSSGYVSCSECSYDSESCTCISADKCYCSLPRRSSIDTAKPIVYGCDTDSCSDSNKCYCMHQPHQQQQLHHQHHQQQQQQQHHHQRRRQQQPTILEQLRQRGIVPCDGTLSRAGSPDRNKNKKSYKNQSSTSSKSLETKKANSSNKKNKKDNLALDYDLFSLGKRSGHSSGSEKVLVVSARDQQGRLVYVGGTERQKKSLTRGMVGARAHHEALSIKKSAEIAAVFGPSSARECKRTGSFASVKSSISLEAGLGYLP
ncbi:formin-J [Aphidius gifuensis]|uniref:formin-J n=1 Tax=Aphidius gifuensis TaxID=684658 RepID=UPI001CDC30A2|nr:formin-J [Aphidius gifuensis]